MDEDLAELELLAVPSMAATAARLLLVGHEVVARGGLRLFGLLVLIKEDKRLGKQHDGDGQHSVHHQRLRELHGAIPQGELILLAHRHADQGVDDVRRVVNWVRPLVQNHDIHPAEEAQHEHHHGDALEDEVRHVPLVDGVAPAQQQPDDHLQHAEEHRQLHLQGVHEQQLVRGADPCPVEPEGVRPGAAAVRDVVGRGELAVAVLVLEARVEQLQADGEKVVVQEAGERGEEAETQHQVARAEQHRLRMAQGVGVAHEPNAAEQQQRTMADVAVHHAEDERERHDGQQRRISLLIPRDAIGIDDLLEGLGVLVRADVGRRRCAPLAIVRVQESALSAQIALLRALQRRLNLRLVVCRVPDIHPQGHAFLAVVQHRVDRLLLQAEEPPIFDLRVTRAVHRRGRNEISRLRAHEVLVGLQRLLLLTEELPQLGVRLHRLLGGRWPLVHVHTEGGADLHYLVLHRPDRPLEVDHEDRLVDSRAGLRVDHAFLDRAELCEGVAPGGPPHGAREAVLVDLWDDTGDVAEAPLPQRVVPEHRRSEVALRAGGAEDLHRGGDDLRLLHRLVTLGHQRHVVLLELQELLIHLLELSLDGLQLVAAVGLEELVHLVLLYLAIVDLGDLVEHEAEDALALVQALRVLAVWPSHLAGVHVLKLDARILAKPVDVPARFLHWQN
mmetsp:Transcript_1374/g.3654  ORF Transcript_1374/g.3654 Transcript_1374/m.3654 type:complete len:673 (-) Transcript_1374:156-2174(-)